MSAHLEQAGSSAESAEVRLRGSITRLEGWLNGSYEGWDPYDGINSDWASKLKLGYPYPQIALTQLHRVSPVNLRRLFGIHKGVGTKALSLFVRSFLLLHSTTGDERYLKEALRLSDIIVERSLVERYGKHAWASHYFTFVNTDGGAIPPTTYDIIGTCNVLKALSQLHQATGNAHLEEVIASCQSFLQDTVLQRDGLTYFQYAPEYKTKIVPNASAEALAAIASSFRSHRNEELRVQCDAALRSLLDLQREDGSWVYSIYLGGKEYVQMDFHQGYLIDGLLAYRDHAPAGVRQELDAAVARATVCYRGQFQGGRGLYRPPREYPADIHNQAQGILTFSELSETYEDRSFLDMAVQIADWTLTNMQDDSGYFYYQKGRLITNKIPYIRWGQAWMLLALASLHARVKAQ